MVLTAGLYFEILKFQHFAISIEYLHPYSYLLHFFFLAVSKVSTVMLIAKAMMSVWILKFRFDFMKLKCQSKFNLDFMPSPRLT